MIKKSKTLNPYLLLIISFMAVVLIGSFLLSMPFVFRNNPNNEWCHVGTYMDAFFTSLSAMSLTGITTYPDGLVNTLNGAGQVIVLVLVQLGGLGIVTILTFLFSIFRRKLQFKDRLMVAQAIAFNNFSEIVRFVRRLMIITAVCETIGFALGLPVFLQLFPNDTPRALAYSVFHSISSFNNAGFDLFNSTNSLIGGLFANTGQAIESTNWLYYYFNIYNAILSLLGGISFLVIIDTVFENRNPRRWSSFTKIILVTTIGSILVGSLLLFLTDGLMMFIGGSPLSTAGGIKVTTVFIIITSILSYFSGKRLAPFKRTFSENIIAKSMTTVFLVVTIIIIAFVAVGFFGVTQVNGQSVDPKLEDNLYAMYLFSVFSFFGNVGFYTGLEPFFSIGAKIVLCFLMLLGHLGPMTFFQLFQNNLDKKASVHYSFVEEDFLIG